ncbi:MAG: hypothetical protein KBC48_00805 [Candidatus Pacebacteria bacterium]|nr:hypothetical protein [Candidatus Paceibacterota bacterium]
MLTKNQTYLLLAILLVVLGGLFYFFDLQSSVLNNGDDTVAESWGSIFGAVLLGPTCPVVQDPPDPICADKPYATSLVVTTPDGARVIKQFTSDESGRFNVDLPAGEYTIRSAAAANILPYCASVESIIVKPNDSTEVAVSCDTGIR